MTDTNAVEAVAHRRRWWAPEVVQTSGMDCGPAVLKCLLEGHGISASYERLREACQTDIDGTSIDTLESVATALGFDAEQIILPVDHLLRPEAAALPAVVLVRLPNGFTHFVVAWSVHGPYVQVMDPASGRRFVRWPEFLASVYSHVQAVPAAAYRQWAGSERFLSPLRRRLSQIGIAQAGAARIGAALADSSWRSLAKLDAATRMVDAMVRAGGLLPGRQADGAIAALIGAGHADPLAEQVIPSLFWSVRSMGPTDPELPADSDDEMLLAQGAVLVSVRPRRTPATIATDSSASAGPELADSVVAALDEPQPRPIRQLWRTAFTDGGAMPALLGVAILLSAAGVALEALLFRCLFDLGWSLRLIEQRIVAVLLILGFGLVLLAFELPLASALLRLGRRLEARLRIAFLRRLPRVEERYFGTRPTSDIAERSHSIHRIRVLPGVAGRFLRTVCELAATTAGIVWLDPSSAALALPLALSMLLLPLLAQPVLGERDLRVRTHVGAMGRFHLDALLGLLAIRAHGAERALRREHDSLLLEWSRAGRSYLAVAVALEATQAAVGFGLGAWLFLDALSRTADAATPILLLYWTMSLPLLGQELSSIARQVPIHRNIALRLLELLGAPAKRSTAPSASVPAPAHAAISLQPALAAVAPTRGVCIELRDVTVKATGHVVLDRIDLRIAAGSHIAIVGPSGAGKSSLVGLLLGWHRPASGSLLVDGCELDEAALCSLRSSLAWVDPSVRVWNRSLLDNLEYGAPWDAAGIASVLHAAEIGPILEKLPDGLQTALGEGGALLSGGEGQRVRLGRAMQRGAARLVILDEPFRGLDHARRQRLLSSARAYWKDATLLCVTHDLHETRDFERVLVLDQGRIVEDGAPGALEATADSRYRALLGADSALRSGFWADRAWRRLRMQHGNLVEG